MNTDVLAPLVALTKRAVATDFNLQQLEALRQNAVAQHATRLDGARQGGGTAGAVGGGGAGLLAALKAALPGVLKSTMGARGKIGAGAALAGAGGLGGGLLGRLGGRSVGGMSVGSLPAALGKPVDASNMTQVAAHLAKQGLDFVAIQARMEKTAGGLMQAGKFGLRQLTGIGRKAAPMGLNPVAGGAAKAPMAAAASNPMFNRGIMGRNAAVAGAGLGGLAGYGHMQDHAQNYTASSSTYSNPLTWFGSSPSHEDAFKQNYGKYQEQTGDLQNQIDSALAGGDHAKAEELGNQMRTGDYGGSFWRMGGLNPFATQRAGYHRDQAMKQQQAVQGQYNTEMGKVGPGPGDQERLARLERAAQNPNMLPNQYEAVSKQLTALRQKMQGTPGVENPQASAIRQRMQEAGMRQMPFKSPGNPALMAGGAGTAAMSQAQAQGFGATQTDPRRRAQQSYDTWERTIPQGPLVR